MDYHISLAKLLKLPRWQLEFLFAEVLKYLEFEGVEVTPGEDPGGVEIRAQIGDAPYFVQVYQTETPLSALQIQGLVDLIAEYAPEAEGIIMSTAPLDDEAHQLLNSHKGIEAWGAEDILIYLNEMMTKDQLKVFLRDLEKREGRHHDPAYNPTGYKPFITRAELEAAIAEHETHILQYCVDNQVNIMQIHAYCIKHLIQQWFYVQQGKDMARGTYIRGIKTFPFENVLEFFCAQYLVMSNPSKVVKDLARLTKSYPQKYPNESEWQLYMHYTEYDGLSLDEAKAKAAEFEANHTF